MFTGQLGGTNSQFGWIVLGGTAVAAVTPPTGDAVRWPYHTDTRWPLTVSE